MPMGGLSQEYGNRKHSKGSRMYGYQNGENKVGMITQTSELYNPLTAIFYTYNEVKGDCILHSSVCEIKSKIQVASGDH